MGCGSSTLEQSGAVHTKPQAKVYPQQQVSGERQHIIIIFSPLSNISQSQWCQGQSV